MSFNFQEALAIVRHDLTVQAQYASEEMEGGLHVPCLLGPTGIGKSRLASDVAQERKLSLLTINCGELGDVTDISGMLVPSLTKQLNVGGQVVTQLGWGLNPDLARACSEPVLLFMDDIDKAPEAFQGAMMGLTATRMVRGMRLHPQTLLITAGNRLEDDRYAKDVSESLRGRLTIIEMDANLRVWAEWGLAHGSIRPEVIGFLQWKPELLHQHSDGVARFPTPRGWEEVSNDMAFIPENVGLLSAKQPDSWRTLVELRCGAAAGADFWAWYKIVRGIDVQSILATGTYDNSDPMSTYAAIYAVATYLRVHALKPAHKGVVAFVDAMSSDMRVALLMQLDSKARAQLAQHFPSTAASIMESLTS